MPTENPKISAYVPQVIYDRFKQFQEERGFVSMSQAAIELFAEYFGINLIDNSTKEFPSGLPDRISQLEQIVVDLKQSYVYLSEKVDSIQSTSEPRTISLPISDLNGSLFSEPLSNVLTELPSNPDGELPITKFLIEQENKSLNNGELPDNEESSPLILLPHQLENTGFEQQGISSPLSNLPSNPLIKINYPTLALRLDATEGYVKNKKSTSSPEKFAEWSTKKDPDKIGWQTIKEGKKVYHCPVGDLSDEQKSNLEKWLLDNQLIVD